MTDLNGVSCLLDNSLQNHHNLVLLSEEVSGAHAIEGALLVYLVHQSGRPDEEYFIFLALRVGAHLQYK